jgi:hypothetical protein
MVRAQGISERPTRKVIADLARQSVKPETTLAQKLEIARVIERLNKQLAAWKKAQRESKNKGVFA